MTIAAAITATAGLQIGKTVARRQKLIDDLARAMQDIHFLLAVEQQHCELHKSNSGESNLRRVRRSVKEQRGLHWSGQFTPGRQPDRRVNQ